MKTRGLVEDTQGRQRGTDKQPMLPAKGWHGYILGYQGHSGFPRDYNLSLALFSL